MPEDRRKHSIRGGTRFEDLETSSKAMRAIFETVNRVGPSESAVWIEGEVGVGKQRLARALHRTSTRAAGPFVIANCAALPADQQEIALLGRAASDDAPEVIGLLQRAHGGTLYLDQVASLRADAQQSLWQALRDAEARPVGSDVSFAIDVRVLSAATPAIETEVAAERFRADLYDLLSTVWLRVPALRERLADLPGMLEGLLHRYGRERSLQLSPEALARLHSYAWPGNVRELENALERSVALSDRDVLGADQILLEAPADKPATQILSEVATLMAQAAEYDLPLRSIEDLYIEQVLERAGGNKALAARILGVNRTTLYRRRN